MLNDRVLVVFGSKHGSTAELAEAVADALRHHELDVDVHEAPGVHDVTPYRGVVVGSAVYAGRWRKEVVHFLSENAEDLQGRDVWVFSSGPIGEHAGDAQDESTVPHRVRSLLDSIGAHEHMSFAGRIDPDELGFPEKLVLKVVHETGGDWRDFDAVAEWAGNIAAVLGHPDR